MQPFFPVSVILSHGRRGREHAPWIRMTEGRTCVKFYVPFVVSEAIKRSVYTEYIRIHSGVSVSFVKNFSLNLILMFSQRKFGITKPQFNFFIGMWMYHVDVIKLSKLRVILNDLEVILYLCCQNDLIKLINLI